MRFFKFFLVVLCLVSLAVPQAEAANKKTKSRRPAATASAGVNDSRYAAFIVNPVTGEVYHSADADGRRYPASLTKMMTLYLLFDALEDGKIRLDTEMRVSEYASTMPQTNLSLAEGETIDVETAIKALIIRSANDVSVVVAEKLGGDVNSFARMMTNKARQLGMNSTVFKNPNGLPNSEQYTTARDMAKLGIALKRDFPRFYPYFSARQFSHDGVTYYTHNRVMLRYSGTDGIKTGFIGASGFNLVTSVTRGGRPLVGVVMGGSSGGWRDSRMITLLDQSYKTIAERGGARGKMVTANLPLPTDGGKTGVGIKGALPTEEPTLVAQQQVPEPTVPDTGEDEDVPPQPPTDKPLPPSVTKLAPVPAPKAPASQPRVVAAVTPVPATPTAEPVVAPASVEAVPANVPFGRASAPLETGKTIIPTANGTDWGIQVGAFSSQQLAEQAARQAYSSALGALKGAQMAIAGPAAGAAPVYRARLERISQLQAKKACEILISRNSPCFIFKAGS